MNAACTISDSWDQPSISPDLVVAAHADGEGSPSQQATLIYEVMREAAACTTPWAVQQLMRHRGRDMVEAFSEMGQSVNPRGHSRDRSSSLETQLRKRGVRQNILDNLALAAFHHHRGVLIYNNIRHTYEPDDVPESVQERMMECRKSLYQHLFGWTFLALVAAGHIDESAPGVDFMLAFMREAALDVYTHAALAEEDLRDAA